jgi:glutamyl/glutaminyl-tRNA synthetase
MSSSGALVDLQKLTFVNSNVINTLSLQKLYETIEKYLQEFDIEFYENTFSKAPREKNEKIILELQKRLTKLSEYKPLTTFFYNDFEVTQNIAEMLVNPKMKIEDLQTAKAGFELTLEVLKNKNEEFESVDEVKNIFVEEIQKAGMKNGQVLWPVRVALSGEEFSPGALELIYLLKKEKSIQRIENILNFLK